MNKLHFGPFILKQSLTTDFSFIRLDGFVNFLNIIGIENIHPTDLILEGSLDTIKIEVNSDILLTKLLMEKKKCKFEIKITEIK